MEHLNIVETDLPHAEDAQQSAIDLGCPELLVPAGTEQHETTSAKRCANGVPGASTHSIENKLWTGVVPRSTSPPAKSRSMTPQSGYHLARKKLQLGDGAEHEASDGDLRSLRAMS